MKAFRRGHSKFETFIDSEHCLVLGVFRYHTLKQILPQLELFETGFDDELKWLDEAVVGLEAYKNVSTLEEVGRELGRHTVGGVLSHL